MLSLLPQCNIFVIKLINKKKCVYLFSIICYQYFIFYDIFTPILTFISIFLLYSIFFYNKYIFSLLVTSRFKRDTSVCSLLIIDYHLIRLVVRKVLSKNSRCKYNETNHHAVEDEERDSKFVLPNFYFVMHI